YLYSISDDALRLHLTMEGDRIVKSIGIRSAWEGRERSRLLSQLSGGQWRCVSLALELAFAELARQRSCFSCNLLVLDEVLSQLDAFGRERVAGIIRALAHGADPSEGQGEGIYSTVLVVLQARKVPNTVLQDS
ncbi:unnamed protein product, partial [Choristocarpus tenellus]